MGSPCPGAGLADLLLELLELPLNALADPAHHRHGFAVADGFVSRAVRAFLGRFAAPRDQGVVVL